MHAHGARGGAAAAEIPSVVGAPEREKNMAEQRHFTAEPARAIGAGLGSDRTRFDMEEFRIGLAIGLEHGLRDPSGAQPR